MAPPAERLRHHVTHVSLSVIHQMAHLLSVVTVLTHQFQNLYQENVLKGEKREIFAEEIINCTFKSFPFICSAIKC